MVNAQEYINKNYPKEKRGKIKRLELWDKKIEGEIDLNDFVNLKELMCFTNKLTKINIKNCKLLTEISCWKNNFVELNLNGLTKLNNLYCDNYLFSENKIKGIKTTALIRLDIRNGGLDKNQDPKYIWNLLTEKYKATLPEMRLIEIDDLNQLAKWINKESIKDRNFLKKIGDEKFTNLIIDWNHKGICLYLTLDQLANSILARGIIVGNRLLNGKDREWENKINKLTYEMLKCDLMNPKQPELFLYDERKKLVDRVFEGDDELLKRIKDLPFFDFKSWKIKYLERELKIEREHAKNLDRNYQQIIKGLREQLKLNQQKEDKATQTETIIDPKK